MFPFLKFLVIVTRMLKITIINNGKTNAIFKKWKNNDDNTNMLTLVLQII